MIEKKSILTYLKIFALFIFVLLMSGCGFEEIDGPFTTYNPNNVPCIDRGECILVCGWKNRANFLVDSGQYGYQCVRFPSAPQFNNEEVIELGGYVYMRIKESDTSDDGIGAFYVAYNNACRGLRYTKENEGLLSFTNNDIKSIVTVEDGLPLDVINGYCTDNLFIQDATSQPVLCIDKNVPGKTDEGNTWCYKNYDQNVTQFKGESSLVYSIGDKTDPDSESAKTGLKNYYTNKGLFKCDSVLGDIKLKTVATEMSNVVTYSDVYFEIKGERYDLDSASTGSKINEIVNKLLENVQEEWYGESAIKKNFGEILYNVGVNFGSASYASFKFPEVTDPNTGNLYTPQLFQNISSNLAKAAEDYLRPDKNEGKPGNNDCDIMHGSPGPGYPADYHWVNSECDSPYLKSMKTCIIDLYKQVAQWKAEGKITDEQAAALEGTLQDIEDAVEQVVGKAVVQMNFNSWDWKPMTCEDIFIKGTNFMAFFKLVYIAIEIAAPILMLVLSMSDFMKATAAGEDALKEASSKLIKRAIIVILIFVLPLLIKLIGVLAGLDVTCITF